jgi:glycine cleavage system H protein
MSNVKYTEDHEWIRLDAEDVATIGITNYAQEQLGDLVFVELPEPDKELAQGSEAAVLESVKAAGEVKAPASGTVVEVNEALGDDPAIINADPEGEGWFLRLKPSNLSELDSLMDEEAYKAYLASL